METGRNREADMSDLEELERRKRELELRRDISRLERNERLANSASKFAEKTSDVAADASAKAASKVRGWGWPSVSVCTLVGAFLVFGGLHDGVLGISAAGALFLVPLYLKLSRRG
jgi:hypothetical protein